MMRIMFLHRFHNLLENALSMCFEFLVLFVMFFRIMVHKDK